MKLFSVHFQESALSQTPLVSVENKSTCNRTNLSTLSEMDVDSTPPPPPKTDLHPVAEGQEEVKGHIDVPSRNSIEGANEKENVEHISPVTTNSRPCEKKKLQFMSDAVVMNPSSEVNAHVQWGGGQQGPMLSPPPVVSFGGGHLATGKIYGRLWHIIIIGM